MFRTKRRIGAIGIAAAAAVCAAVTTTAGGTRQLASAPAVAAVGSVAAVPAIAPVEITLSGLDGHGPVRSTVQSLAAPAKPAAIPSKAPAAAVKPTSEGIQVQQATGSSARFHAHATASTTTLTNGLDLIGNGTSTFTVGTPGSGGMRYVYANFKVRNAQFCTSTPGSCTPYPNASHNLTLVAAQTTGTLSATSISKLKLFDGSNANPALAVQVLPTDGLQGNGNDADGKVLPAPGLQSLQVFTESEVANMSLAANVTGLLPYGFAVRNLNDPSTRSLPAPAPNGDYEGGVTIALAFPTQAAATANPFSISVVYQPVDDTNTRVTEGVQEANQAGDVTTAARAAALSSTDVVALGAGNHVTATDFGNPICSVRTAGPASMPTATLVSAASTDANVVSAPYNARGLAPTSALNVGFCQPISAPSTTIHSQFVVAGSESGPRTQGGKYASTISGGGTAQLALKPSTLHPFFSGEKVNFTLTSGLTSTTNNHPSPFVGSYTVAGETPSTGEFRDYSSNVTGTRPISEAVGDLDNDGIPDLAVVNKTSGTVTVSYGNGDGTFGAATSYSVNTSASNASTPLNVAIGDFNRDGYPDLAVTTSANNTVSILMANPAMKGHGFNAPTTVPTGSQPDGLAVADFNDDGLPDFVATNLGSGQNGTVTIGFSNGDGTFSTSTATANAYMGGDAVVAADFDGDGSPDFAVAYGTSNAVCDFRNNGDGSFSVTSCASTGKDPVAIAAGDINADKHVDIVTANKTDSDGTALIQQSNSTFSPNTLTDVNDTGVDGVGIGDVTGDGAPDIVFSAATTNDVTIVAGNGSGNFSVTGHYTSANGPAGLTVADLNGDGVADVVVANTTQNTNLSSSTPNTFSVFLGDGFGDSEGTYTGGLGTPVAAGQRTYAAGVNPQGVAVGDFNRDGALDVAVANTATQTTAGSLTTYFGNGRGGFTAAAALPLATGTGPADLEAADFNGDGILDLAVTNVYSSTVTFLQGNGDGTFTAKSTLTTGGRPVGAVVGDVNGDGLPDVVTANQTGDSLTVLVNTGNFAFNTSTVSLSGSDPQPSGITVGDFNADGKLDLAVAESAAGSLVILSGDGTGGFTTTSSYSLGSGLASVATGDVNNDGIPDLAVAAPAANQVDVLTGAAGGTFSTARYAAGVAPASVAVADLNGDGKDDLLVGNAGSTNVTELLSNGSGFSPAPGSPVSVPGAPGGLALGDFAGTHKLAMALTSSTTNQLVIVPQK